MIHTECVLYCNVNKRIISISFLSKDFYFKISPLITDKRTCKIFSTYCTYVLDSDLQYVKYFNQQLHIVISALKGLQKKKSRNAEMLDCCDLPKAKHAKNIVLISTAKIFNRA